MQAVEGPNQIPIADEPLSAVDSKQPSGLSQDIANRTQERAAILFEEHKLKIFKRTDRWFAYLMMFQWVAGIAAAIWVAPLAWAGTISEPHIHVWAAIFLGGAISAVPIYLGLTRPGTVATRHTIATGQMLTSALLIHLTGGRIETHFHVFGSLAFLSFYRDWRVLVTASAVVGADHMLRGIYFPQSVYGTLTASPWRWLEHVGWVAFEDIFLALGINESIIEMKDMAQRRSELELTNQLVEAKIIERTAQLSHRAQELEQLNAQLAESEQTNINLVSELSRSNSELEQFAYVASHDLQEPLRKVLAFGDRLQTVAGENLSVDALDCLQRMQSATMRMKEMIEALLELSRVHSRPSPFVAIDLAEVTRLVLSDLEMRIEQSGAQLEVSPLPIVYGDPTQIHQLLLNLIANALKFRRPDAVPVVKIHAELLTNKDNTNNGNSVERCQIIVEDNGIGFDERHKERIFSIFQRLHGRQYEGSGMGLALCRKIAIRHGGEITAQSKPGFGSSFFVTLPLNQTKETKGATGFKTNHHTAS